VAGVAALLKTYPPLFVALQWVGAAYLAGLGCKMIMAQPGEGAGIQITPGHYFRETMLITLLNPKAILFYFAFFSQFIDPVNHQGWITFAVMAATIAVLGFTYCWGVVVLTHFTAERIRAHSRCSGFLQKLAGLCLIGFGLKMVLAQ
jgi:threonine/homoserine/homoserine lactone efflux protein